MKNTWKSAAAGATLIMLLTLVAYLPATHGSFVFDDYALIVDNPMVRPSEGIHGFSITTTGDTYYPLTWSLWWLEWRLWGENPMGYHVVNALLHAANAILVWLILRQLKIPGAWVAGLVFAVHPVNVATVAWISEQKNTLSMFFYAVAILLYLRFDETTRWRWHGLSLAAFLLALLSKTAVVMLPVVLLGCVWWLRRRVRVRDILYSVPFFGLSLVLGLATVWFHHYQLLRGGTVLGGFAPRLAMAGRAPWFYLSKALLPVGLTVIYPKGEIDPSRWISYAPGMILIGCFLVFWWKRKAWGRPLLFGLGYFLVTLFPALGFFDQAFYSSTLVADHWQYYSIVGVIALAVAAGELMCRRLGERGRYWGMAASVVVLMVLGTVTWRRSLVYADEETLWRDNLAKNPNAWMAHNNLALELARSGKLSEAKEHFEESLQINPKLAGAHYNLGNIFLQEGRLNEAIGEYQQALRITPGYVLAHYNLGVGLERMGRVQDAIGQYEETLRIRPDYAAARYSLGNIFLQEGRLNEAIGEYRQALRSTPDYAAAHNNLGKALLESGKVPEAIGHFEQALRLGPDSADAHSNLGAVLQRMGKLPEAVAQYEQALRINPDYVEAHFNLGLALEKLGRTPEAIEHYEQALRLRPDFSPAKSALARLRAGQ